MSIIELGSIGEFVGALAVLVTLVYLALQIRNNQRAVLAQTLQSRAQALALSQQSFITSPELASAWAKFHEAGSFEKGLASLNNKERLLIYRYLLSVSNLLESDLYLYEIGQLSEEAYQYNVRKSIHYQSGYWKCFNIFDGSPKQMILEVERNEEEFGPFDYDQIFKVYGNDDHDV